MSDTATIEADPIEADRSRAGSASGLRSVPLDVVLVVVVALVAALYPVLMGDVSMTGYGYDGGVYLGASVRLVHGALPYRDFAFGQPPGIILLMTPVSVVSIVLGTHAALWLARLVTILVVAANSGLVAGMLRRFGVAASLSGGLCLALFSAAYAADSQLKLEPYLVLFCLLAAALLFEGTGVAGGRRARWAGVMIGIAALVKLNALLPAIVMLVVIVCLGRRAIRPFVSGALLTFGVACIGFFLLAPSSFFREVLLFPVLPSNGRQAGTSSGFLERAQYLGYSDVRALADLLPSSQTTGGWIAVVAVVLVAVMVALRRSRLSALEWFAVGALALVTPALLISPHAFTYYLYFQAPFLALTVGSMAAWGLALLRRRTRGPRRLDRVVVAAALAGLVAVSVLAWQSQSSFSVAFAETFSVPPLGWVSSAIPAGACVVTDDAYLTLMTDRFSSATDGCPEQVDADATWGADYPTDPPPPTAAVPALTDEWQAMMSASSYVLLASWTNNYVPWTPGLTAWFHQNFKLLGTEGGVSLYQNEFVSPL